MERLQNDQRFGFMAVNLGYFDTLLSCSARSTASEMPSDSLATARISPPGLVRMSVGYMDRVEQRWRQLDLVLTAMSL